MKVENDMISRSALLRFLRSMLEIEKENLKHAHPASTNYLRHQTRVDDFEELRNLIANISAVNTVALREEDAEFLANLRHELLTQPTDGNRDPRFWGVIEEKLEWGYNEECGEGWGVYDGEMCCEVGELDDLQSLIDELTDHDSYDFNPEDFEGLDDPEEVVDRANELGGSWRFSLNYYRVRHKVSEDHLFLTKKACQEYIDRYGYNHKKPHTYVMTAERCPEYDRLLKILKDTEWKDGA